MCAAAKLGNVKESLTLLKVFNMVQSLIAASVRGGVFGCILSWAQQLNSQTNVPACIAYAQGVQHGAVPHCSLGTCVAVCNWASKAQQLCSV
jgi:hypothetical protein